jgi:pyruvate formate-lyase activating enzyme-like uncharacterized protein
MAGYIGMYLFGDDRGNDGVNSIYLGILVGTSDRQWLEPVQIKQSKNVVKPVWDIGVIIPDPDNYQNSLIDACIAFAPHLFMNCTELENVKKEIGKSTRIDFTDKSQIPKSWNSLRRQALPIFEKLSIFDASIRKIVDIYPRLIE